MLRNLIISTGGINISPFELTKEIIQSQYWLHKNTCFTQFLTLEFKFIITHKKFAFIFLHISEYQDCFFRTGRRQIILLVEVTHTLMVSFCTGNVSIMAYNLQFYYSKRKLLMQNQLQISDNQPNSSPDMEEDSSSQIHHSGTEKKTSSTFSEDLANLQKAKERFKQFLSSIGDLKKTNIRPDILQYMEGNRKKSDKSTEAFYQPEALVKKIELRINKMIKTKKIKRNWGEQDLKILVWVISKYSESKGYQDLTTDITDQDWKMIASLIPGATGQSCMFKWLGIKKVTLADHSWKIQESNLLTKIVNQKLNMQGQDSEISDWKEISQELYRLNLDQTKVYRNAKQCREHWTCYLSPALKRGPWQLQQDMKLLKFIKDNKGLKKWSQIAKKFQGRTQNALKNRFTLLMDKIKRRPKNKGKAQLDLITQRLQKYYLDQLTFNIKGDRNHKAEQFQIQQSNEMMIPSSKFLIKKEEYTSFDTNESFIAPLRVEHVNISELLFKDQLQFFRNLQPGVVSDGTFKKIASCKNTMKVEESIINMGEFQPYQSQDLKKQNSLHYI